MYNRQTRVDTFPGDLQIDVTGRKNHVVSTQQFIKKSYTGVGYAYRESDNNFDFADVMNAHCVAHFNPKYNAAGEEQPVKFQTERFPINKSIQRLDFMPESSDNDYDTMPDIQRTLLPYLCEKQSQANHLYDEVTLSDLSFVDAASTVIAEEDVDLPYLYDPTENECYYLRIDEGDEKVDDRQAIQDSLIPKIDKFGQTRCAKNFSEKCVWS